MTIFQSIFLGIVQGLTEFLPVSSSGHLVIVPYLLGWEIPNDVEFVFDVLVQVATLVAVIVYFWNDLIGIARAVIAGIKKRDILAYPQSRLGIWVILATIPAGIIGLLIKPFVEAAFASPQATAVFLLATAGLLVIAERAGSRSRDLQDLSWIDALWIGFFQALSIFPGLSRSGSTITGGMLRNLKREPAARFSFLMSIPIMLAAGLLAASDLRDIPDISGTLLVFIPGFIAAGVIGYFSIRWLLQYLTRRPLYVFSIYCVVLSCLTLAVSWMRG
jgi:undecaprenyl-diphosphatase